MVEELKAFIKQSGLSQASIARSLGKSAGQISQYLGGYYKGDVENLEKDLKNFMATYNKKERNKKDINKALPLVNLRTAHFIISEAIIGNEMSVIYGEAGVGKSVAVNEYVKKDPTAVLIEAVPGMGLKSVLNLIAKKISVSSGRKNSEELIYAISEEFKRREAVLIIDEAENLTTKTLEAIRRIWDFSKVATVLVGTYALLNNLKGRNGELLQLYSRISGKYEFAPLKDEDWEALFGEWASDIKAVTTHLRRAVNVYSKALRFASMNGEELNAGHIKSASNMVILD